MKILAIEREYEGKTSADFQPHSEAEARQVWRLQQQEIIREIYFRADQTSAVLILECPSLKEAERHLSTLPLVRENLIYFDVIPLKPYPGYERLFRKR